MSMSVNNVISNYTYTYQSKLHPILDRDYDSVWSKDEVSQYAADYKSATGTELDVDAIFNKYDTDSSSSLEFAEYETAAVDDAFGLSLLSQKKSEASSSLGESTDSAGNASSSTQSSNNITSTATLKDVLSDYTYTSQDKLHVILDKDYDSVWSSDEIAQYAADYKSATGTALDIDGILKQYDTDSNGSLEFAEYEAAAVDDAFGAALLSQKKSEASNNTTGNTTGSEGNSSSNTPSANTYTSTATLDDVLSDYTYNYQSKLNLMLDKDYDSVWSQDEIGQYAADYKSATGVQLNTSEIFKQYDADGSNALEFSEYEKALANDAFGVSLLSQKQAESMSSLNNTQSSDDETSAGSTTSMSDWLQSLSNTTRLGLVNTTVWADNTSNLLNAMLSANNSYSNINYGLMQYTNINSYASSIYKASNLFMSI